MSRKNPREVKRSHIAPLPPAARVASHRSRQASVGRKRVEIVVPSKDVALIRQLAERLRAGPAEAAAVRRALEAAMAPAAVRTGKELVALLRTAPLEGATLELERDRSPTRELDFGQ